MSRPPIALVALLSIVNHAWIMPAAITGGAFYGFAGIRHSFKQDRNRLETYATLTDLWMFVVLLAFVVSVAVRPA